MAMSADVRVFVSFDVVHDTDLGERLFEQSLAPGAGFRVTSRSDAGDMTDGWRDGLRRSVRDSDEVIVICGEHTSASERMSVELRIAQQEQKPCLLLWGRRGRMCSMPHGIAQDASMYTWTWEVLVRQVAQTLRDALWRSESRAQEVQPTA
jgi:hypothetical protein